MVSFEARVISVESGFWEPSGERVVIITLGMPPAIKEEKESSKHSNVMHFPRLISNNRIKLIFSEGEWGRLECRPAVGDVFLLTSEKNGFKILKKT